MAAIDQMIGRYRLTNRLGQGGMGEVWLAVDTGVTQREVAVKLVISEDDPAMLHALAGEARSMASLPMQTNLVALLDVVESGSSLALVMEYVPGPTLRQLLRSYGNGLPWGLITPIAEGLLTGLEHAHSHQVIHRDLKPENIKLLNFDGSKPLRASQVKILDFGLARVQKEQSTRFTRGAAGTFAYMAPEQLTGQPQSETTDLYAFGILLFEMATGQPPFGGPGKDSFGAVYQGHTSEPPPLPSLRRQDAPAEFDQAILAALSKQSGSRPQNAEAMAGLVRPVLHGLASNHSLAIPAATAELPTVKDTARTPTPPKVSPLSPPLPALPGAVGNRTVLDVRQLAAPTASANGPAQAPAAVTEFPGGKVRRRRVWPWLAAMVLLAIPLCFWLFRPSVKGTSHIMTADIVMVEIPAGTFKMGTNATDDEWLKHSRPVHEVTISHTFRMGKYPVTQAQWQAVIGNNPSSFKNAGPDAPVETVSWDDCQQFISRLNGMQSQWMFRLPTEAEWEYACRAGTEGATYGNLDSIAWYSGNSGGTTHPVGQKRPNAFGLYDMLGNVWQWCQDWSDGSGSEGSVTDPTGPSNGSERVVRGGSGADSDAYGVRSAFSGWHKPAFRLFNQGFRVVAVARTQ